jgi:hypothetical protein
MTFHCAGITKIVLRGFSWCQIKTRPQPKYFRFEVDWPALSASGSSRLSPRRELWFDFAADEILMRYATGPLGSVS